MGNTDIRSTREEFLAFRIGTEEYAIDVRKVREIRAHTPLTRFANGTQFVRGSIAMRGALVPIVDLRMKLKRARENPFITVLIVLDIHGKLMGIVVDAVSDVVALAAEQIRPVPYLAAAIERDYVRGLAPVNGRMLIVVDIERLMTSPGMGLAKEAA